ncbi:MAG: NAD(P)-dependent oxidoreductase [Pseudomonadota bacterium]|nr:NAD(P)-dependent oxidoreductase [Pseudomonadota bacterium]
MQERANSVAMIGLGLVGEAIVHRLQRAGYTVLGWDTAPDRRDAPGMRGVTIAGSAHDAAVGAGFVLLALPDTAAVKTVLEEITAVLVTGTIVVDFGTSDPRAVTGWASLLRTRDVALVDAPLSGSSEQIRKGEAVAMVGGEDSAWQASALLVQAIAPNAFHMGGSGSGSRAKLATNLLLGLNRAALAEAMVFAEALGIDPGAFLSLVRQTPAYSRAVDAKGEKMRTRDYKAQSRIRQHRKDLRLMLEAARAAPCALPFTETHARVLDAAIAAGDGELDNAAIIETIRRWPPAPALP